MRKVKEVLRLRFGLGLLQNQIARSCSISQSSVRRYLEKAAAAGLTWPLPEDAYAEPGSLTRTLIKCDEGDRDSTRIHRRAHKRTH